MDSMLTSFWRLWFTVRLNYKIVMGLTLWPEVCGVQNGNGSSSGDDDQTDRCWNLLHTNTNVGIKLVQQDRIEEFREVLGFFLWGQWIFSTDFPGFASCSYLIVQIWQFYLRLLWQDTYGVSKLKELIVCINMILNWPNIPINILLSLVNK